MARADPEGRGLLRKSFAMVLSVKRLDRGLWGSVRPLESVKSDRSAVSTEQDNLEHLKDEASEGFPLSFSKENVFKPYSVCNIAYRWDFGTWCVISKWLGVSYPSVG